MGSSKGEVALSEFRAQAYGQGSCCKIDEIPLWGTRGPHSITSNVRLGPNLLSYRRSAINARKLPTLLCLAQVLRRP